MKPVFKYNLRSIAIATSVSLAGISSSFAYLPLPNQSISLYSAQGQYLLQQSQYKTAYNRLAQFYISQERNFCGVASGTMVLNALQAPNRAIYNQENFFSSNVKNVVSPATAHQRGMSLTELSAALQKHGANTTPIYGNKLSLSAFRSMLENNLSQPNRYLIALFSRPLVHEVGNGHFSPIAAYDAKSDSVLLMDVAQFKYPPHWIKIASLWQAIRNPGFHGLLSVMA